MMKNDENISVSMDEIPEEYEKYKKAEKEMYDLASKIYSYSSWATNISVGVLGFFIAVLLQLKSENAIFNITNIIIALFFITASISIGFYLKIRYEIATTYKSLKNIIKTVLRFLKILTDKLIEKGADMQGLDSTLYEAQKKEIIKKPKHDSILKNIPIRLVYFQLCLVFISILLVALYVIKYIFF